MVIGTKAREAWDVCKISAWMEISLWAADSAKTVLCVTRFLKVAWGIHEKRWQEGLQEALDSRVLHAEWNGTSPIHDHSDYTVNSAHPARCHYALVRLSPDPCPGP